MTPARDIHRLLEIMAALRTPVTGCPWDLEQTFATVAPYAIEEAYEVADAIMRDDRDDLCEELGDLLLQVVFHARMAEEEGSFTFGDVVEAITTKMIRRHPHVFGPDAGHATQQKIKANWAEIKAKEKAERAARRPVTQSEPSLLASVKTGLPPLARAMGLQQKASTVGFDWNDPHAVIDKIHEEAAESRDAIASGDKTRMADEIGDLMFAVVNLARHAGVDPDSALRGTNAKFERRFGFIETSLSSQGRDFSKASLDEMEKLWVEAKENERQD
jgi:ATP diphosphatase